MDDVVVRGRDPKLLLTDQNANKTISQWGNELFVEMQQVAQLLDKAYNCSKYVNALAIEAKKINDSSLTPSAQILDLVVEQQQSLTKFSLEKAQTYRDEMLADSYTFYSEQYFIDQAEISHQKQQEMEQADKVAFDDFLTSYFS